MNKGMKKLIVSVLAVAIFFTSTGFAQLTYATEQLPGENVKEQDQDDAKQEEPIVEDDTEQNQKNDQENDQKEEQNQVEQGQEERQPEETDSKEQNLESVEAVPSEDTGAIVFEQAGEDAPQNLKINLLEEPYGVTREAMSFSWEDASVNGMQSQSAYRLVIAKSQNDVSTGTYQYDTGWVENTQNTSVFYDMTSVLDENTLYYWQVQIRNAQGQESSLSNPQAFTTAIGDKWESKTGIWGGSSQKIVMLRSEISRDENIEKAVMSITASSPDKARQYVYNLYINGKEVGIGPVRQDNKKMYYNTYDITEYLSESQNVIGVINYSEEDPAFLCQITYYMQDGSQCVVMNSGKNQEQWKALDADEIYFGNDTNSIGTWAYTAKRDSLNANKFPFGWENAGYHTSSWKSVTQNSNFNKYTLTSSQMDNMKRYEVSPETVEKVSDGKYFIDFGKEIIGGIQLNIQCSSRNINIEYGEELNEDGTVRSNLAAGNVYKETWTLKSGQQTLSGIGMKTFRYVLISNLPDGFRKDDIKGLMIRQKFDDDASDFQSSNQVLNDVYALAKYTSKATTQDVYVDSQNRERLPYEGDALITALTSYSYSASSTSAKFTAEYLLNHTTWPAEYSLLNASLIYQNYMYTGDRRNLEESYSLLKKKVLENYFDDSIGLMRNVVDSSFEEQKVMTDWPAVDRDGYKTSDVEYNTVFNAVCVGGYADMAKIAEALGYEKDKAHYEELSETIKKNMIQYLYDSQTGRFWDGLSADGEIVKHSAQHATAYALTYGVFDSEAMAESMYAAIESDGELKMSLYGTFFLLQGLYNTDHGNLARKIMSNPGSQLGVKSWAYMMYGQKATITTEFWDNIRKTNMTMAHAWGSSPGNMLVRGMFGIQPTSAGFDTFQIKLQPGGLSQASVKVPTLKGEITASYNLNGNGGISGSFTVPSNSRATFYVPVSGTNGRLFIDGTQVSATREGNYLVYQVESGEHSYQAETEVMTDDSEWVEEDVVYSAYRGGRWSEDTTNRIDMRNPKSAKIESIRLKVKNQSASGEIQYAAYVQGSGWQELVSGGQDAGTAESGKCVEAFRVKLTGEMAEKYNVYYRAYIDGKGWMDWAMNGEPAGSSGYSKEVYKIQVTLVKKGESAPGNTISPFLSKSKLVNYETHVQSEGWQPSCGDGEVSGTVGSGKRLEAIKISLDDSLNGKIKYQTHVQSYGWQEWKENEAVSGTSGEGKRLEAIKIELEGEVAEEYDIYYRVYVQSFGWLDWAKNGEAAGSEGYGKRLEAIQIKLIKKEGSAPGSTDEAFKKAKIAYKTQVQSYGWQDYVYDGELSGTTGKSKRLEAIQIVNRDNDLNGSIQYRTHIQGIGWESNWKKDGEVSGTVGESRRLEAIQVKLSGELEEKYDIYYRVQVQSYGWLGWAKNGESAGTQGHAKRLEGIEIMLKEKDSKAPGETLCPFVSEDTLVSYQTHVQGIGWQEVRYDGLLSGTSGQSKRLEAVKIQLGNTKVGGRIRYRTQVQTYGWLDWVSDGTMSGTSGQSKRLEAIQIELTGEMKEEYDVYYRVHAQSYGWLGWAKNGKSAGTEGLSKRLEAIEIVIVKKGENAPGSQTRPFVKS